MNTVEWRPAMRSIAPAENQPCLICMCLLLSAFGVHALRCLAWMGFPFHCAKRMSATRAALSRYRIAMHSHFGCCFLSCFFFLFFFALSLENRRNEQWWASQPHRPLFSSCSIHLFGCWENARWPIWALCSRSPAGRDDDSLSCLLGGVFNGFARLEFN